MELFFNSPAHLYFMYRSGFISHLDRPKLPLSSLWASTLHWA